MFVFYRTDNLAINSYRVAQRVIESRHKVPISKIISRYYRSIANSIKVLPFVNKVYFYDNSQENLDPQLLFRTSQNTLVKIYSNQYLVWTKEIIDKLQMQ